MGKIVILLLISVFSLYGKSRICAVPDLPQKCVVDSSVSGILGIDTVTPKIRFLNKFTGLNHKEIEHFTISQRVRSKFGMFVDWLEAPWLIHTRYVGFTFLPEDPECVKSVNLRGSVSELEQGKRSLAADFLKKIEKPASTVVLLSIDTPF